MRHRVVVWPSQPRRLVQLLRLSPRPFLFPMLFVALAAVGRVPSRNVGRSRDVWRSKPTPTVRRDFLPQRGHPSSNSFGNCVPFIQGPKLSMSWPRPRWICSEIQSRHHSLMGNAFHSESLRDGDGLGSDSEPVAWDIIGTDGFMALSEHQLKEWDEMGWWDLEEVLGALTVFKEQNEHTRVPAGFIVPSEVPWPMQCWELPLGEHLNILRRQGTYIGLDDEKSKQLESLGFDWEPVEYDWEDFYEALTLYKNFTGTLDVPETFKIPASNPWPSTAAGLQLGREILQVRRQRHAHAFFQDSHSEERGGNYSKDNIDPIETINMTTIAKYRWSQLEALNFFDSGLPRKMSEVERWELFRTALEAYLEYNGDLDVPVSFVIPSEEPWPLKTQGYPLGVRAAAARSMGYFLGGCNEEIVRERIDQLDDMGFIWDSSERRWEVVVQALNHYKSIYGNVDVPQEYVVPPLPTWPERLWALKLGHRVNAIRSGVYTNGRPSRHKQLEELGFQWDLRDVAWDKVLECLTLFKELDSQGKIAKTKRASRIPAEYLQVPRNFVVPSEKPWPERAWGLPLGERCAKIRSRGDFVVREPGRVRQLEELKFFWGKKYGLDGGQRWLHESDDEDDEDLMR